MTVGIVASGLRILNRSAGVGKGAAAQRYGLDSELAAGLDSIDAMINTVVDR